MLDILLAAFLEALRLTQLASVFLVIAYVWNYRRMLSLSLSLVFYHFTRNFSLELTGLKIRKLSENDFLVKQFANWFGCVVLVEIYCWNVDMCNENYCKVMKVEHLRLTEKPGPWTLIKFVLSFCRPVVWPAQIFGGGAKCLILGE